MKKPIMHLYHITAINENRCEDNETVTQDVREATLKIRAGDIAEAVKLAKDHLGPDYEVRNVNQTSGNFVFNI